MKNSEQMTILVTVINANVIFVSNMRLENKIKAIFTEKKRSKLALDENLMNLVCFRKIG